MRIKSKVIKKKNNIENNIDYLSNEYHNTYDILSELNRITNFQMSHSLMLQWWVNNETSIDIINELINFYSTDKILTQSKIELY